MTAGAILLVVIYFSAFQLYREPGSASGPAGGNDVLPFQVLFRDLPGSEQRIFRAMQEGLEEAASRRASAKEWPAVEALAAQDIPPFARDVLDRTQLRWELRRDGLLRNYVGTPSAAPDAPAFLILIQEPDPVTGEKPQLVAGAPVDEEHKLLADGTLLHVTYWKRSPPASGSGIIAQPEVEGWTQIRVASPFAGLEARP